MQYNTPPYLWTEHRKIITPEESGLASLPCFGICSHQQAQKPLESHIHPGCMEIVMMIRGFQVYEVGGETFSLSGSDVFVTFPDELHSSASQPESVSEIIWMQVDLSPGRPLFSLDAKKSSLLREALLSLPRLSEGRDSLFRMMKDAFFLLADGDEFARFRGETLLVCALQQLTVLASHSSGRRPDVITGAIQYIHDHIAENISLDEAARACGLSLSRFKTCFKEVTGSTPREYINQVKVRRAQRLLAEGMNVTDAAMAMGFNTPNYFSVVFRKFTGMSPTEYLKALNNG